MTIETKIEELTKAVTELTAALNAKTSTNAASPKAEEKPKAAKKESTPPKETEVEETKVEETEDDILSFDEVATTFKKFVADGNREAAVAILKEFKVEGKLTADKLPAAKFREFLDAIAAAKDDLV